MWPQIHAPPVLHRVRARVRVRVRVSLTKSVEDPEYAMYGRLV